YQNVEARLKRLPFDPDNRVGLPLMWGTVGFLWRADTSEYIDSWGSAFLYAAQHQSKVALLDDPRLGMGAALKFLGLSLNTTASPDIQLLRALMLKRTNLRIDSAAWSDALLTGEVV